MKTDKEGVEMKQKIKIGVMGGYRGVSMIRYCEAADNACLVAVCDKNPEILNTVKENIGDDKVTYYDNFEEFINHDMDAVVLANYATEHAPFAIRALKKGLHVFSEVLPCQTMKEAVELIEEVEKSGLEYAYGENYCYMRGPYEMKKLYREGKIGEFEYGECEYVHNCEPFWHSVTYGEKDHWRNRMYSTFYCTHSIGPLIHATGLRPVRVSGFEGAKNERCLRVGRKSGSFGMEIITLDNGATIKSIHGSLYKNSVWYSMYGSKGRMETARESAHCDEWDRLYVQADDFSGAYGSEKYENYVPEMPELNGADNFGHGGSDFYSMYNFVEKILGDKNADVIDVYEALDMFLPGLFAFRSILNGGAPVDIPDLRDKKEREKWRNDTACTDPEVAGDLLLPTKFGGTPDIDDGVYEHMKKLWDEECKSKASEGYLADVMNQGKKIK